jgi:hypothetical protein
LLLLLLPIRPIDVCVWTSHNTRAIDIALMLLDHGATAMPAGPGSGSAAAPAESAAAAAAASASPAPASSSSSIPASAAAPAAAAAAAAEPVFTETPKDSKSMQPCELLSNALRNQGKSCPFKLVQRLVQQGFPLNVVNNLGGGTAVLYAVMFQLPKVRGGGRFG